jgi:hypothetical protein
MGRSIHRNNRASGGASFFMIYRPKDLRRIILRAYPQVPGWAMILATLIDLAPIALASFRIAPGRKR